MSEHGALPQELVRNLVGSFPTKQKLLIQGVSSGATLFAIFELLSIIDKNLPRFPVPWLLILIITIAQAIFISRIISILRMPRRGDLFFVYGLDFKQRQTLALTAFQSAQTMLKNLSIPASITAVVLEIMVLHIYSAWEIILPPLFLFGWLYFLEFGGKTILKKNIIKPVKTDRLPEATNNQILFSAQFSKLLLKFGRSVSSYTPLSVRPLVLRNIFILFRTEPLLIPLFMFAAPVLQIVLVLIVQDMHSPFVDFFSSIMFFAISSWYASILREANAIVRDNPHYQFDRKKIMVAYIFTFNILAIPLYLVYIGAVSSVLFSVAGITRLLTTLLLFTLGACITSTFVFDPFRKDSEQSTSVVFFGGGCIGLFIAYFGSVFPLLVFIAFMLKEWKSLNTTGFEIASDAE
jgi:hypothetical protein